jgi:hypothetical protein
VALVEAIAERDRRALDLIREHNTSASQMGMMLTRPGVDVGQ